MRTRRRSHLFHSCADGSNSRPVPYRYLDRLHPMVVCWHSIHVRGDTVCKVLSNRIWICLAQHSARLVYCTQRTHSICSCLDYQSILSCLLLVCVAVCCTNSQVDYLHRNCLRKILSSSYTDNYLHIL